MVYHRDFPVGHDDGPGAAQRLTRAQQRTSDGERQVHAPADNVAVPTTVDANDNQDVPAVNDEHTTVLQRMLPRCNNKNRM